jgi:two-component system sensor histidine kinase BarA
LHCKRINILKRILAIDDDPINRQLLNIYLSNDFEFKVVNNAKQAVDALNIDKFDLIVTDINLEGNEDGVWLARYIKAAPKFKDIPVIAFTAHLISYLGNDNVNKEFDYIIEKPVMKKQFVAKLNDFLEV